MTDDGQEHIRRRAYSIWEREDQDRYCREVAGYSSGKRDAPPEQFSISWWVLGRGMKTSGDGRSTPEPRKGMPSPKLGEDEFKSRYLAQFVDPAFRQFDDELTSIAEVAWQAYEDSRKAPITQKAGPEFADPDYDLSVDWLAAREAIRSAQKRA